MSNKFFFFQEIDLSSGGTKVIFLSLEAGGILRRVDGLDS